MIIIWAILVAELVSINPLATRMDPATETLRYDKARIRGPTKSPEKLISASRVLIITAAPVVPTPKSLNRSPKRSPNDCSIDLVQSCPMIDSNNYFSTKWNFCGLLTLTALAPITTIHPHPPSGGTSFFFSINMVLNYLEQ